MTCSRVRHSVCIQVQFTQTRRYKSMIENEIGLDVNSTLPELLESAPQPVLGMAI